MLVDFRVKNFRSIKDEQTFSMVSNSQPEHKETHTFLPIENNSFSLVKTTAIYGPNAAGKSNVLKALRTMRDIVVESATQFKRGDNLPIKPFLFDGENDNISEFEITFIAQNIRYQYGFSATSKRIMEEWLIAFPKSRPQHWFARAFDNNTNDYTWQFGEKLMGQKSIWKDSTRDNALFLSTAVQLNSEQLQPVFDWFDDYLKITSVAGWNPDFTMHLCEDSEKKKQVLNFLKTADIDIEDIEVEKEEFDASKYKVLSPEIITKLEQELQGKEIIKGAKIYHLDNYGNKIALDFDDESDGTKKLFAFIGPWLDSLENGKVIVIDELHDNFHPLMVKFLIDLFHNNNTNKSNAQLIFTTHETSILNQDTLRRDQVWFCEKKNKATQLFALSDFSPRKGSDLEKAYLSGRYGALPFFKDITMAMGA